MGKVAKVEWANTSSQNKTWAKHGKQQTNLWRGGIHLTFFPTLNKKSHWLDILINLLKTNFLIKKDLMNRIRETLKWPKKSKKKKKKSFKESKVSGSQRSKACSANNRVVRSYVGVHYGGRERWWGIEFFWGSSNVRRKHVDWWGMYGSSLYWRKVDLRGELMKWENFTLKYGLPITNFLNIMEKYLLLSLSPLMLH